MDYNITGRTKDIHIKTITTKHINHPNKPETRRFLINLSDDEMFSLKKLTISCIAGYDRGIPFPPAPLPLITITDVMEKEPCGVGYKKVFQPERAIDIANKEVLIESGQFFQIVCTINGMLYILKEGCSISRKECIGFSMLNQSNQGQTIMDEGSFDALNDFIVSYGGPEIRSLPFNLASLNLLPEVYQNLLFNKMFSPNIHGSLQLTTKNLKALPQEDISYRDFLGDSLSSEIEIDLAKLKELAKFMLNKGWFKKT